jgi:hypothetical protein
MNSGTTTIDQYGKGKPVFKHKRTEKLEAKVILQQIIKIIGIIVRWAKKTKSAIAM